MTVDLGGRPLAFASPEELQEKIDAYFAECEDKGKRPLVTGLALALDVSRQTLLNYAERGVFGHVIARAKSRVEAAHEAALFERDTANGAKFSLSASFDWAEKSEVAATVAARVSADPLSDDEWAAKLAPR